MHVLTQALGAEEEAQLAELDSKGRDAGEEIVQVVAKAESMLAEVQEALHVIASQAVQADVT